MLKYLQLLHLADSALPIGSISHSFGLECMTVEEHVTPANIYRYLNDILEENLLVDAVFCRNAHSSAFNAGVVQHLNQLLSAWRVARESRLASLALGRRFLSFVAALECSETIDAALIRNENHLAVAFGLAGAVLGFDVEETVMAFLHQSVLNVISSAQRLIRLGQADASRIAWDLKPLILEAARKSAETNTEGVFCFAHLPDLASMRHTTLTTRLFIS